MGKKLKLGLVALVGVLGVTAFASNANAAEFYRGRPAHFERVARNDFRRDRFERRWVYDHGAWGWRYFPCR